MHNLKSVTDNCYQIFSLSIFAIFVSISSSFFLPYFLFFYFLLFFFKMDNLFTFLLLPEDLDFAKVIHKNKY